MKYFNGIQFEFYQHLPKCSVWIDRSFTNYALNFATRGNLKWKLGKDNSNSLIELETPVAWWTFPGQHFQYGCDHGESWDHRFVTFQGCRVQNWIDSNLFPCSESTMPLQKIHQAEAFLRSWNELFSALEKVEGTVNPQAVHCLEGLLLQLNSQSTKELPSVYQDKFHLLFGEIRGSLSKVWDWEQVSDSFGISYPHFRREFLRVFGTPPHQFLTKQRMEEASKLLTTQDTQITKIAAEVGFDDPYHFSRRFRQYYHLSPREYRNLYSAYFINNS
jgi:AraC family transcriptional regulator, arabinose operon regulatory protein